ncbi:MAG: hypothetical protein V3V28_06215 [Polaribacter sp.]|uniref:hypothetical protein n=1 Tax=Polaribacter sp. TaxID=1920175 RepID=UPI002F35C689
MKKLLFVLAFVGGTMFSTVEAKESKTLKESKLEIVSESDFFCRVVVRTTRSISINSDGSSTETTVTTRTFYPCSN